MKTTTCLLTSMVTLSDTNPPTPAFYRISVRLP